MLVSWDRRRQRVHMAGCRCHHGAVGVLLMAAGVVVANPWGPVMFGLGAALVYDDWHDIPWTPTRI